MSLISSARKTKRRSLGYGLATICLLSLICIGVITRAESAMVNAEPSTAVAGIVPTPTAFPSPSVVPSVVPFPGGTPALVRDLTQYENGGSLTVGVGTSDALREGILNQTRTFLLRKWSQRQLGRVSLITSNLAGRMETRSFFVERNVATNAWKITIEMPETEPAEFYFVEEIGVAADGRPIIDPRTGSPQPTSRALHMKNSSSARSGMVL
jgi:hypothetical protein